MSRGWDGLFVMRDYELPPKRIQCTPRLEILRMALLGIPAPPELILDHKQRLVCGCRRAPDLATGCRLCWFANVGNEVVLSAAAEAQPITTLGDLVKMAREARDLEIDPFAKHLIDPYSSDVVVEKFGYSLYSDQANALQAQIGRVSELTDRYREVEDSSARSSIESARSESSFVVVMPELVDLTDWSVEPANTVVDYVPPTNTVTDYVPLSVILEEAILEPLEVSLEKINSLSLFDEIPKELMQIHDIVFSQVLRLFEENDFTLVRVDREGLLEPGQTLAACMKEFVSANSWEKYTEIAQKLLFCERANRLMADWWLKCMRDSNAAMIYSVRWQLHVRMQAARNKLWSILLAEQAALMEQMKGKTGSFFTLREYYEGWLEGLVAAVANSQDSEVFKEATEWGKRNFMT